MSIIPLLLDLEQQMAEANGYGYHPNEHRCPVLRQYSHIPLSHLLSSNRSGCGGQHKADAEHKLIPSMGKDGFQIKMNVHNFAPDQLSVKVLENTIVIEAKHEERPDQHGAVFRHFIRKYVVPEDCDLDRVISTLTSDGILTVKSPLKYQNVSSANERVIQIQQTGPANLTVPKNDGDE